MSDRHPREVSIDGLVNIRDIGGLVAADGRIVRSGRVFRSDNPKSLTESGRGQFREVVNPRTVIDLRMSLEVDREGYELDDHVNVISCPMTPQSGVNERQILAGMCDNLVDDYMKQIDVNARFVAQALGLIAERTNQPVVIHCTAGKDRTGIIIAMLLDILGVPHDEIVADYHLTTKNMAPVLERIRNSPVFQENGLADAPDWIFASDPQTMAGFLARMTATYGGAEAWALGQGMTHRQVEQLRTDLLVS